MPEIAKHIVIRRNGVTIDGTEVPWHIAAQSIEITGSGVVYLPILVDQRGSIDVDMGRKLDAHPGAPMTNASPQLTDTIAAAIAGSAETCPTSKWTAERLDALPEGTVIEWIIPGGQPLRYFIKDLGVAGPVRPWVYTRGGVESSLDILRMVAFKESLRVVSVPIAAISGDALDSLPLCTCPNHPNAPVGEDHA